MIYPGPKILVHHLCPAFLRKNILVEYFVGFLVQFLRFTSQQFKGELKKKTKTGILLST
jgi:hypothetical protein